MDDHGEGLDPLQPDWGDPMGLTDLSAEVARTLGFEQSGEAMEGVGVWPSGDSSDSDDDENMGDSRQQRFAKSIAEKEQEQQELEQQEQQELEQQEKLRAGSDEQ